jgi:hypothetical protein
LGFPANRPVIGTEFPVIEGNYDGDLFLLWSLDILLDSSGQLDLFCRNGIRRLATCPAWIVSGLQKEILVLGFRYLDRSLHGLRLNCTYA